MRLRTADVARIGLDLCVTEPAALEDPAISAFHRAIRNIEIGGVRKEWGRLPPSFLLEEELLFPANSQVAFFLSMDVGEYFALDSVNIKIDGKEQPVAVSTQNLNRMDGVGAASSGASMWLSWSPDWWGFTLHSRHQEMKMDTDPWTKDQVQALRAYGRILITGY